LEENIVRKTLGRLPEPLAAERDTSKRRILDPGAGLVPDWVNNFTAALYPFIIGTTSQQIVPANPLRCYLLVQNKSALADMFINFGQKASTGSIIIIPRGNYEFVGGAGGGPFSPGNSVWVLGSVAAMSGVLVEGVLPPVLPA